MSEEKEVKISNLKGEIQLARALSFMDFNDAAEEGAKRTEAVKVVDTISRLEMDEQQRQDDLRLKEEDLEFHHQQEEERLEMERKFREEQLKIDRERLELEKERDKRESEQSKARMRLDYIRTGAEVIGAGASTGLTIYAFDKVFKAKDEPYVVDRLSFDAAKKLMDKASRGFGKLHF